MGALDGKVAIVTGAAAGIGRAAARAFAADNRADAVERAIDSLLKSPAHGERMARLWLDVAHYGDTHGYDKDKQRPNAWPYRDWLIRAFNADMPYRDFATYQIAGDMLQGSGPGGVEALGFLAAGPWDFIGHAEVPETKIDGKIARHLDRDDIVTTVTNTFLGITVQCAQCHDHKFDPVTQAELGVDEDGEVCYYLQMAILDIDLEGM